MLPIVHGFKLPLLTFEMLTSMSLLALYKHHKRVLKHLIAERERGFRVLSGIVQKESYGRLLLIVCFPAVHIYV